ncbi:hypothetical protein ACFLWK_00240 [Chloroflexota bacterium]
MIATKIRHIVIYLLAIAIALALSSCASGVPQDQYDLLQSELTSSQQELEELQTDFQQQLDQLNIKIEDLTKSNAELEDQVKVAAVLNEELSAIVAYSLWFDYYYETGAYNFDTLTEFDTQLEGLISATGDTNCQEAFQAYSEAQTSFFTLEDSLPEDGIWTESQFDSWLAAGMSLDDALAQLGEQLADKINSITWFNVE